MATRTVVFGAVAAIGLAAAAGAVWWEYPTAVADTTADDDLPVPPVPPRIAEGEDYNKCLSMVMPDPSGALDFAESWAGNGGGDGAMHCRGLAEVELGDVDKGAELLDQVGQTSTAAPAARAAIYGQAGQSWMMAGNPQRAYDSADKALALNPDDPDLLVDRAIAANALDRFQQAIDDLTKALDADPSRGDALVLRASAYRHLDQLDKADDDVERALGLDADDPDALLEHGILRQRRGDPAAARHDWERAIAIAPDTETADLAQQNLALLDAGPYRR